MRQIVCIKQVPEIEHLKFDNKTKRIIRDGVPNEINAFDRRAISEAINARNKLGGEVIVVTMGPPQARDALVEALAMGCDRAIHMNDRAFAGADTLATARALALLIRPLQPDIIWCGKYSLDGETAQVPPMLAELLDLPQVMGVTRIEYGVEGKRLTVTRETDDGFETLEVEAPVVFSAGERLTKPIKVKPADLEPAQLKPIQVVTASELGDAAQFGAMGSPTWVESIYPIEHERKRIVRVVDGNVDEVAAAVLADIRVAETAPGTEPGSPLRAGLNGHENHAEVWVVAELFRDEIRPVTFELLGGAQDIADKNGARVCAVVMAKHSAAHAAALAAHGADKVYAFDAPGLDHYATEPFTAALVEAIRLYKPWAVLMSSTANGRDLAPRVAARLGLGLTGDAIGLDLDATGRLMMLKPAFGGSVVAPVLSRTEPAMVTVRAGMMSRRTSRAARTPEVVLLRVELPASRVKFVSYQKQTDEGVALDEAETLIGVGMGVGSPENLPLVYELAHALDGHCPRHCDCAGHHQ